MCILVTWQSKGPSWAPQLSGITGIDRERSVVTAVVVIDETQLLSDLPDMDWQWATSNFPSRPSRLVTRSIILSWYAKTVVRNSSYKGLESLWESYKTILTRLHSFLKKLRQIFVKKVRILSPQIRMRKLQNYSLSIRAIPNGIEISE